MVTRQTIVNGAISIYAGVRLFVPPSVVCALGDWFIIPWFMHLLNFQDTLYQETYKFV